MDMANLSELDLQNLRHLIGGYDTSHCKMKEYASCAEDTKVKQFFQKVVENKICKFCKETFGNLKIRRIFAVRFALKIRAIFLAVFANFSQHETGSLNYW